MPRKKESTAASEEPNIPESAVTNAFDLSAALLKQPSAKLPINESTRHALHPLALALLARSAKMEPSKLCETLGAETTAPLSESAQTLLNSISPETAQILLNTLANNARANCNAISSPLSEAVLKATAHSTAKASAMAEAAVARSHHAKSSSSRRNTITLTVQALNGTGGSSCYVAPSRKKLRLHSQFLRNLSMAITDPMGHGRRLMNVCEIEEAIEALGALDQAEVKQPEMLARIRRKLQVRLLKLERGLPYLDLDDRLRAYFVHPQPVCPLVLKSTQSIPMATLSPAVESPTPAALPVDFAASLERELYGDPELRHTLVPLDRKIKVGSDEVSVLIHQDRGIKPARRRLLESIRSFGMKYRPHLLPQSQPDHPRSIDFVHFQPEHAAQVNALLESNFWSSIDVSSEAKHPGHAIVACYGRRVVGCVFMDTSPEVYADVSYLCVEEGWRHAGIGSRLLYFALKLVQSDWSAHVPSSNVQAIRFLEKFGFEDKKTVRGYFDRFYPAVKGKQRRDAVLMWRQFRKTEI
jgi:ribosomal protein S18 acetylase RimI-like enzyme